jgi:hypothetical protein
MAKTQTIDDCTTPAEVEAWAAAEEAPLHAEMTEIDRQIVELRDRKTDLHAQVDAIEAQSAERRYELRGDDAGPDQILVPDGALSDAEIEKLRRVVEQHDRRRA